MDAHAQLARESEAREKLEESMKQAFMRGESDGLNLNLTLRSYINEVNNHSVA